MTGTIFAVSSGAPPAAIAILRVSGPGAAGVAVALAGGVPPARRAVVRTLRAGHEMLDRALLLWFPGPASATGEDLLELHLHGGRAVVAAVERAIAALPDTRRAAPGEFTRRALANGRIDVTQAFGLADLLTAETEKERRAAIAATEGGLARDLNRWSDDLAAIRARIEAAIDYDEEGDVAVDMARVRARIVALSDEIAALLSRPTVERLRQGMRVVLAGAPNAGKSSLFNALIEEAAAIVSPVAGTTRDRIERTVHRGGQTITLVDTAGLRSDSEDAIEREGIERSRSAMATADLVLWLDDGDPPVELRGRTILLHPRADLRPLAGAGRLAVSILDGASVQALWSAIGAWCDAALPAPEGYALHDIQRAGLAAAVAGIGSAAGEGDPILMAEALRMAARRIAGLTGTDDAEAMLDALFSRFCVGK